ncbi:MAG TPA: hypothetical protein VKP67_09375 [Xanthobacteraceae bacterium]|nr:hypothetical protein [Xanthobacteraceae bacterium]
MRERFSGSITMVTIAAAAAVISVSIDRTSAQAPSAAAPAPALKTPWGEPDLQGIWTDENDTPLQRPAKYAAQEFFTPTQRAELDEARTSVLVNADADIHAERRGTARDVAGAYNSQFVSFKRTGARTSLIVDPPNGQLPPLTPEAQKIAAAEREFRLALLQATDTCKEKSPACGGGKYDPTPSPRFAEVPPRYITVAINRNDSPEDGNLANRCLTGGLPEFGSRTGSYRRIVQTPSGISMFYDVGQGQGWQRNIVMDGSPHLPATIRQWYGDSRGHWEGSTLVIDVTNFSPKTDFQGSRENLHLVERWTRTSPTTLEYAVTIEDPTVWTKAWTVKEEFTKQSDKENRLYYEPRCIEGNFGLPGLLRGARMDEATFAQGRGPDPRTMDYVKGGFLLQDDPLR